MHCIQPNGLINASDIGCLPMECLHKCRVFHSWHNFGCVPLIWGRRVVFQGQGANRLKEPFQSMPQRPSQEREFKVLESEV